MVRWAIVIVATLVLLLGIAPISQPISFATIHLP